jgi:hypothetical protein
VVGTKCIINLGGDLHSDQNLTVVQGTTTGIETPPPNVSIVVAKNTPLAGRQFRGRLFAPICNMDESDVAKNGSIISGALATQQIWWNHVMTNMTVNDLQPVLLHEPPLEGALPAPTQLTGFRVTQLVGTNRRRLR